MDTNILHSWELSGVKVQLDVIYRYKFDIIIRVVWSLVVFIDFTNPNVVYFVTGE